MANVKTAACTTGNANRTQSKQNCAKPRRAVLYAQNTASTSNYVQQARLYNLHSQITEITPFISSGNPAAQDFSPGVSEQGLTAPIKTL